MREARRSQWPIPLASRATKQTARKAPSLRVAAKCGACVVALLGFVVPATTFVARLAAIRILPATRLTKNLIRGSLSISNTELPLLEFVRRVAGAGRITTKRTYSERHTPSFTYQISSRQALSLLAQNVQRWRCATTFA